MDRWTEAIKAAQTAQAALDEIFAGTDREATLTLKIRQVSFGELRAKAKL